MLKNLFFTNLRFRSCYFLLLMLALTFKAFAQKEIEKAKTYLKANAAEYHLSADDIKEIGISSAYLSPSTGWYHIYFVQKYQSIEVYNGILNATLVNDNVVNVGNTFVPSISSKVPNTTIIPQTPLDAISKTVTSLKLLGNATNTQQVRVDSRLPNGHIEKAIYTNADLSKENIIVKLYWFSIEVPDGKGSIPKVGLVWNVELAPKGEKHRWSVQVDAISGDILDTKDMVIRCNFGSPAHLKVPHICDESVKPMNQLREDQTAAQPFVNYRYNVFDYPTESPLHGSRTIVNSPFTKFVPEGTGPGTTNGWHDDGTTTYTTTRGNNVLAKDDIDGNNEGTIGSSPTSATWEFDYPYTKGLNTAVGNRNAAITNLFYWNNTIHDVLWKYGFDEPSGNFQKDNMSRGGAGNDYVLADAQDGEGLDNAYFTAPVDGISGRMEMYLWNNNGSPLYQPDGDFDNGIISHEYGHGWSIRLTGGPGNSSCLDNKEQPGEGWSDFLTLMMTTNWSSLTSTVASANIARSVGTYALGEPITGPGIRPFPYSYDMANVNAEVTYAKVATYAEPHGIGSIWATMLWDMTWEIIFQDDQIVNNIYNTPANVTDMRGNVAAFKLVNEGLRLQPCSPSFVDARNAILKADTMLFNGRYSCAIWKAFARRGLGRFATTGLSSNDRNITQDFTPVFERPLTSANTAEVCSGTPIVYTATTSAGGVTTYNWSRAVVSGISNPAATGNSATINEILINTTTTPIVVTYEFYLTPEQCSLLPQSVKVTVNPSPIAAISTYNVCKDGNVPAGQGLVMNNAGTSTTQGVLTAGSPTYQRGNGDNNTTVYSAAVGNGYHYSTHTFIAPANGSVSFEITGATLNTTNPYDTYLSLYHTSFIPASPAINFVRGDDDSGNLMFASKITHNLVAGTTYIVVVTTYSEGVTGGYTLSATSPVFTGTIGWFTGSSGGSSIATGKIFNPVGVAGSGVPNTSTAGTTFFYASSSDFPDCRTKTSFIINAPTVGGTIAGSTTFCSTTNSGTLTLGGHTGAVVRWESSTDNFVSNIVPIYNTTITLVFSNLTQTTKYRVLLRNGSCADAYSTIATITVTVVNVPTPTGNSRCGTGAVKLTATGCAGGTINWYAGVTGGTSLATGTTYTTPSIANTTTYYVSCTIGSCTSARAAVQANININLTMSGSQVAGNYRASQTITSTANVATGVKYYAAKSILMNPGFQAGGNEVFLAKIEECP